MKVCSLFCILLLTNVLRYAIFISIIGMALYALSIGSLHTYCAALRAKSYKKAAHSAAFLLLRLTFAPANAILLPEGLHTVQVFSNLCIVHVQRADYLLICTGCP